MSASTASIAYFFSIYVLPQAGPHATGTGRKTSKRHSGRRFELKKPSPFGVFAASRSSKLADLGPVDFAKTGLISPHSEAQALLWLDLRSFFAMDISKAAVGLLVAGMAAGAGGAYIATKSDVPAAVAAEQGALSSAPVEQSEAIVNDTLGPAPAPVAEAAPPAPLRVAPVKPVARVAERPRTESSRVSTPAADTVSAVEPSKPAPAPPAIQVVEPPRIVDNQASRSIEPAGPLYDELVIAADSVIGLEIETAITSERARVEDPVAARVTRDVKVGNRVAIPAGARVTGEVTSVERGGRLKDRARLGVRFTSVVLADGTRVPIQTETIYREGDSPTNESAAKIGGGAIGGAILGGILGGGKGAAIGSIVGAGAGTGAVVAGGRNAATLPSGTPVTVRVNDPVTVTVER
jgi:hypothetical protein